MGCPTHLSNVQQHSSASTASESKASSLFLLLIQTLLIKMQEMDNYENYPKDYSKEFSSGSFPVTFDFIIVGGGTAGCILANRLTENPKWNVLLLEAGSFASKASQVPLLQPSLKSDKEDWAFKVEESPNYCQGTSLHQGTIFQGRGLGGSTIIAPMLYGRPLKEDWKEFSVFNNTWKFERILNIFRRLEDMKPTENPENCVCPIDYEENGPLPLRPYDKENELKRIILEAAQRHSAGQMTNNQTFLGYLDFPVISEERRINFGKIFIQPLKERKNFYMSLNSSVEKILFTKPPDNKAIGVSTTINGRTVQVKAKREVLLTAGAINSPRILLQSGIGIQQNKSGIKSIKELPVGKNLHAHYILPIFIGFDFNSNSEESKNSVQKYSDGLFEFLTNNSGILTEIGLRNFVGYLNLNSNFNSNQGNKRKNAGFPNLGIHHEFIEQGDEFYLRVLNETWQFCGHVFHSLKKALKKQGLLVFGVELIKPSNRYFVELKDEDFSQPPLIKLTPNCSDEETLLSGYKFVTQQLLNTKIFKKHNASLIKLNFPSCRCWKFNTDEYIKCYARNLGYLTTSLVGSCKIGLKNDLTAVVGEDLIVHGFRCLRVVDSSVIPSVTTVDTLGTVAVIAERAAELIKEKWRK